MSKSKLRNMLGKAKTSANIRLGRGVYGNIATFGDNFIGGNRWKKNKAIFSREIEQGEDAKLLHKNGAIGFDLDCGGEVLKDIYSEYLTVIEDSKKSNFTDEIARPIDFDKDKVCRAIIKDTPKFVPSSKKILTPKFIDFLHQYYQSHFKLYSIHAWRTYHISNDRLKELYPKQPYSILWHVDGHPIDTLKVFIALSDISEKDGPLNYQLKQRSLELKNLGFHDRFHYNIANDILESGDYVNKLTGPLGTTAICNTTSCIHKAGVPEFGRTRDILEFQFESSDKPFILP